MCFYFIRTQWFTTFTLHHGHMGTLDPFDVSLFLLEDNGFTPHHGHNVIRPVWHVFSFTRRQWVYTASWTFSTRLTCKHPVAVRVGDPHQNTTKQLHCHHGKHFTLVGFLKVGGGFLTIALFT